MSKTSLSTCLILGLLLGSSLAVAQPSTAGEEPRETAAKPPESVLGTKPARVRVGAAPAPLSVPGAHAAVPAAPAAVRGSAQPLTSLPHTASHWYGWQTLTTDGASILLTVMALRSNNSSSSGVANTLGWLSIGTFVAGGPVVHFAHGNVGKGLGSLALRVGMPVLGGVLGSLAERTQCSGGDFCGLGGAFLGGLAGVAGTIAIDSAVLSYERVPERTAHWPTVGVAADGQRTLLTAQGRF